MRKKNFISESRIKSVVSEVLKKIISESLDADGNLEKELHEKLLNNGVKDVTTEFFSAGEGEKYPDNYSYDDIVPYLSASGEDIVLNGGVIYNWFIQTSNNVYCSRHNFTDEWQAQENCEKYRQWFDRYQINHDAWVDSVYASEETEKYGMDTCVTYDDGEWYD